MLKLHCFAVASSSGTWLYAYRKSIVEKSTSPSCDDSEIDWAILFIRQSMFCIWYLFLWMALFIILESMASFIAFSLLTVITIGDMKFLSLHLSSFITLPFSCNFLSSCSIWFCKCIATLRPRWWIGVKFVLNLDFTLWFIDRPIRFTRLENCFAINCFKLWLSSFSIIATFLPSEFGDDCWLTWMPSPWKRSRPISALWLFGTTMRSALPAFHPLHWTSQYKVPLFLIGVFVKLLRLVGFVLRLHQLFLSRSSISWAIRSVIQPFELPESTITQYLLFPNVTFSLVGVVDPSVGENRFTR